MKPSVCKTATALQLLLFVPLISTPLQGALHVERVLFS